MEAITPLQRRLSNNSPSIPSSESSPSRLGGRRPSREDAASTPVMTTPFIRTGSDLSISSLRSPGSPSISRLASNSSFVSNKAVETKDPEFVNSLVNILEHVPKIALPFAEDGRNVVLSKSLNSTAELDENEFEDLCEDMVLWETHASGVVCDFPISSQTAVGIDVWKIVQFKISRIEKENYGNFETGEVYIVLHRSSQELINRNLIALWNLFLWIGSEAHPLKAGVGATFVADLARVLRRRVIIHRELQNDESALFYACFPRIRHVPGNAPHGFTVVGDPDFRSRLIRVSRVAVSHSSNNNNKGKKKKQQTTKTMKMNNNNQFEVEEVAPMKASLKANCCCLFEVGKTLFLWNGADSDKILRFCAAEVGKMIKSTERVGRLNIVDLDSASDDEKLEFEVELDRFDTLMKASMPTAAQKQQQQQQEFHDSNNNEDSNNNNFYRIDDVGDSLEVVQLFGGDVKLPTATAVGSFGGGGDSNVKFPSSACLIVDTKAEVYLWKGKTSSFDGRIAGWNMANDLVMKKPPWVALKQLATDTNDALFYAKINPKLPMMIPKPLNPVAKIAAPVKPTLEDPSKHSSSVLFSLRLVHNRIVNTIADMKVVPEFDYQKLKIWRADNWKLVPLHEDEYGQFAMSHSYLCQFTHAREDSLDGHILFLWQGWRSKVVKTMTWGFDLTELFARQLEEITGSRPTHCTIFQGCEPLGFLKMFGGGMIVFESMDDVKNLEEERDQSLVFVVSGNDYNECCCTYTSADWLIESHCFLVIGSSAGSFLWCGGWSSKKQRRLAEYVGKMHCGEANLTVVEQGRENDDFWKALGRKTKPLSHKMIKAYPGLPLRCFSAWVHNGEVKVTELFSVVQSRLESDKVLMFDAFTDVYIWVGKHSEKRLPGMTVEFAKKYIRSCKDGRSPTMRPRVICMRKEPLDFKLLFPWWCEYAAEPITNYRDALSSIVWTEQDKNRWKGWGKPKQIASN